MRRTHLDGCCTVRRYSRIARRSASLSGNTGTSFGGGLLTAGGLYFSGASTERTFRAYDTDTGAELWKVRIPSNANAVPMSFRLRPDSRQYIVVAAGGNPVTTIGDALIAYALPE